MAGCSICCIYLFIEFLLYGLVDAAAPELQDKILQLKGTLNLKHWNKRDLWATASDLVRTQPESEGSVKYLPCRWRK